MLINTEVDGELLAIQSSVLWDYGAIGSAGALQAQGSGFESP